jgi:hypothetical protein
LFQQGIRANPTNPLSKRLDPGNAFRDCSAEAHHMLRKRHARRNNFIKASRQFPPESCRPLAADYCGVISTRLLTWVLGESVAPPGITRLRDPTTRPDHKQEVAEP